MIAPVCSRHIIYEIERPGGLAKAVKPARHICVRPTYQHRLIYDCHLHTYIRRSGVRALGPTAAAFRCLHAPEIVFSPTHARQQAAIIIFRCRAALLFPVPIYLPPRPRSFSITLCCASASPRSTLQLLVVSRSRRCAPSPSPQRSRRLADRCSVAFLNFAQ